MDKNNKSEPSNTPERKPRARVPMPFAKIFAPKKKNAQSELSAAKRRYSYLLEFRCRGTLIYSEKTDSMPESVGIGRAPDNEWKIPQEDRLSSDYQARINLSHREATITACKGKNFRNKGKTVTSKKLVPNDRIAIGDCELFVKDYERSSNLPCDVHRLEFLNGPKAGSMVRLENSNIKIGSAKDNDIPINDDVVSGHHAEIKISEDGETWLRDLGSQNGTFVNGARMGKSERMLMDSDVISIAHHDFRFLDRNVIHTRTNVASKLLAILVTAIVTIGAFGAFYASTPRSETILNAYESQLQGNNFDGARSLLSQLPYSREFKKFSAEYPNYQNSLIRHETVFKVYNNFKQHLENSDWQKAMACIGQLNLDNQMDWNWNESEAPQYLKEASHAKACLIQMYKISNALSDTDMPAEKMKSELLKIEKTPFASPEFGKSEPEYLQPLCKVISQKIGDMRKNVDYLDKLDATLNGIDWEKADISKVLSQVNSIKHKSIGGVRIKAQNAEELLKKIASNIDAVKSNQHYFYNLQFDKISRDISFISADDCLNYDAISNMRAQIIRRNDLILKNIGSLKYIIANLRECGIDSGTPKVVKDFNSKEMWNRILSFKSLESPPPNNPKETFADEYDKMLGFKYFYDIISQIPSLSTNIFSSEILLPEEYHPQCIELSDTYKAAEEAFSWLSIKDNKWMLKEGVAELKNRVESTLKTRLNLLEILDGIAKSNPDERKFFVAKAAYFYFAAPGSISKDEMEDFSKKWRTFRQRQYAAWEKYNPMDSANIEKIKSEILSNGIPGDPIVNRVWE